MKGQMMADDFKPLARIGGGTEAKALLRSERFSEPLREILPQYHGPDANLDRFVERYAMQTSLLLMGDAKLRNCTQISIIEAVLRVAETGLSLAKTAGEAYLVPFQDRKNNVTVATFMPGYRGLIRLATQAGTLLAIRSGVVYKGDRFTANLGTAQRIDHEPGPAYGESDEQITHVYAVLSYRGGVDAVEVMTRSQVERIRRGGNAANGPAWRNHWGEMARKTVIRRAIKSVPSSTDEYAMARLYSAVDSDVRASGYDEADLAELRQQVQADRDADFQRRLGGEKPPESSPDAAGPPESDDLPETDPEPPSDGKMDSEADSHAPETDDEYERIPGTGTCDACGRSGVATGQKGGRQLCMPCATRDQES